MTHLARRVNMGIELLELIVRIVLWICVAICIAGMFWIFSMDYRLNKAIENKYGKKEKFAKSKKVEPKEVENELGHDDRWMDWG